MKDMPKEIEKNEMLSALQNLLYDDTPENLARHFNVGACIPPISPSLLAFGAPPRFSFNHSCESQIYPLPPPSLSTLNATFSAENTRQSRDKMLDRGRRKSANAFPPLVLPFDSNYRQEKPGPFKHQMHHNFYQMFMHMKESFGWGRFLVDPATQLTVFVPQEKGNELFKKGPGKRYYQFEALNSYTEGIESNGSEKEVNAKLHCNRALIQIKFSKRALLLRGAEALAPAADFSYFCGRGCASMPHHSFAKLQSLLREIKNLHSCHLCKHSQREFREGRGRLPPVNSAQPFLLEGVLSVRAGLLSDWEVCRCDLHPREGSCRSER